MSNAAHQDTASELRELLEQHRAIMAEIKRTRDKAEERQRARAALINSGDESKADEILTLGVQLQMIDPAIKRLETKAAELGREMETKATSLHSSVKLAVRQTLDAAESQVRRVLCPLFGTDPDSPCREVREHVMEHAEKIFNDMPIHQVIASADPLTLRGSNGADQAAAMIRSFDRLASSLKQAAPFLPNAFNPFN